MLIFPVVLAAVWCAVAAELVVESARTDGRALVFWGRVLAAPPPNVTIGILCAVSASAALAMVIAVAYGRGRRLERRMAAELDDRWRELAEREGADTARNHLLQWRADELHALAEELLAERQGSSGRHLVIIPDIPGGAGNGATTDPSRTRSRH